MTLPETVCKWILDRKKQLCHRQLLVITGEQDWVTNCINIIRPLVNNNSMYVGDSDWPHRCQNSTYRSQLGVEFDHLVYDAFSGLRANALIALSGTIKSGGLMILLVPPFKSWSRFVDPTQQQRISFGHNNPNSKSYFIEWLIDRIQTDNSVGVLSNNGFKGNICTVIDEKPFTNMADLTTPDQLQAIDKIVCNYDTKTTFQLVLTADRGRGKSATLGLAAQRLMNETRLNIAVTAPHKSMTQSVFKHLTHQSNICYKPFDELLSSSQPFDLLFVDEAAAIPTRVLKSLVAVFPKIIFCTTNHGYEGSGKGFELRFTPYLKKRSSNFTTLTLESPVRWFKDDVLEEFWFKAMLMTPLSSSMLKNYHNNNGQILIYRIIGPQELINNPPMLYQIFQLLVNAHYQTTPDDLVRLLDAQEQSVHVMESKYGEVIGVSLVSVEGGTKLQELAQAISQGSRRVNGHLIPQRLAFVRSSAYFAQQTYTRIIRIAVKSEHRRLKVATKLINHITKWAIHNGIDFIGASFGASTDVVKFWQSSEFLAVHLGLKRDASSGEHSLIVLKPCKTDSESKYQLDEDMNFLCKKFADDLSFQRDYRLSQLDRELVNLLQSQLLQATETAETAETAELDLIDQRILEQFTANLRPLFSCECQLTKLIALHSEQFSQDYLSEYEFFHHLLIEKWPYSQIREYYSLSGKKQIEDHARYCCSNLLRTIKKTQ